MLIMVIDKRKYGNFLNTWKNGVIFIGLEMVKIDCNLISSGCFCPIFGNFSYCRNAYFWCVLYNSFKCNKRLFICLNGKGFLTVNFLKQSETPHSLNFFTNNIGYVGGEPKKMLRDEHENTKHGRKI
jgi:hypothetical protein